MKPKIKIQHIKTGKITEITQAAYDIMERYKMLKEYEIIPSELPVLQEIHVEQPAATTSDEVVEKKPRGRKPKVEVIEATGEPIQDPETILSDEPTDNQETSL